MDGLDLVVFRGIALLDHIHACHSHRPQSARHGTQNMKKKINVRQDQDMARTVPRRVTEMITRKCVARLFDRYRSGTRFFCGRPRRWSTWQGESVIVVTTPHPCSKGTVL